MGGKEDDGPSSNGPSSRYTTRPQQGTRLHQTRATPYGRKGQDQVYALRPRITSLARRGKSPNPLPDIKASPEKIRAFSHQESSIRRILRTRTSGTVENSPGDPRQPHNTLQGDGVTRPELYPTSTRPYRWRRGVRSRRSTKSPPTRPRAQTPLPSQVERFSHKRQYLGTRGASETRSRTYRRLLSPIPHCRRIAQKHIKEGPTTTEDDIPPLPTIPLFLLFPHGQTSLP